MPLIAKVLTLVVIAANVLAVTWLFLTRHGFGVKAP